MISFSRFCNLFSKISNFLCNTENTHSTHLQMMMSVAPVITAWQWEWWKRCCCHIMQQWGKIIDLVLSAVFISGYLLFWVQCAIWKWEGSGGVSSENNVNFLWIVKLCFQTVLFDCSLSSDTPQGSFISQKGTELCFFYTVSLLIKCQSVVQQLHGPLIIRR